MTVENALPILNGCILNVCLSLTHFLSVFIQDFVQNIVFICIGLLPISGPEVSHMELSETVMGEGLESGVLTEVEHIVKCKECEGALFGCVSAGACV